MSYFICESDETGWRYDPSQVLGILHSEFPNAEWEEFKSPENLYCGYLTVGGYDPPVEIHLARDGTGIELIGRTAHIIPMVLRLAPKLPPSPNLVICDNLYSAYVPLNGLSGEPEMNEAFRGYW